jgi:peptidoglycan-associated lipoprotein
MKFYHKLLLLPAFIALAMGGGGLACKKKGPAVSGEVGTTDINLEKIHFDFDKYDIRSGDGAILNHHATWLNQNSKVNVIIEGNTDEWGTEEYNLALGERRAVAAKNFLVNLGISPDRLSTISYGESRPINSAHDRAAWSENRRDEFKGRK